MAIKHKAVKASGDAGLASEWNDDHVINGNVDFLQHQILNHVIENRTDFPAGPVEGQVIWRSDLNLLYVYDGAAWAIITTPVEGFSGVLFKNFSQLLFNSAYAGFSPSLAGDGEPNLHSTYYDIAFMGWDVSTASYSSKYKSVAAQDTEPTGVFFKPDGTAMYIMGYANDTVYQY